MKKVQNIVGPIIRELREKKGMSQEQLVAKLNLLGWDLSRGTFSKIEAQIRCVADYEIPILAAVVGVAPSELLTKALEKHPKNLLFKS
jgi:transcriptional regulator with XRE-family HTH domain